MRFPRPTGGELPTKETHPQRRRKSRSTEREIQGGRAAGSVLGSPSTSQAARSSAQQTAGSAPNPTPHTPKQVAGTSGKESTSIPASGRKSPLTISGFVLQAGNRLSEFFLQAGNSFSEFFLPPPLNSSFRPATSTAPHSKGELRCALTCSCRGRRLVQTFTRHSFTRFTPTHINAHAHQSADTGADDALVALARANAP